MTPGVPLVQQNFGFHGNSQKLKKNTQTNSRKTRLQLHLRFHGEARGSETVLCSSETVVWCVSVFVCVAPWSWGKVVLCRCVPYQVT